MFVLLKVQFTVIYQTLSKESFYYKSKRRVNKIRPIQIIGKYEQRKDEDGETGKINENSLTGLNGS